MNAGAASAAAASVAVLAVLGVDLALFGVWGARRLALRRPTFAPAWSLVDVWLGGQIIALLLVFLSGIALAIYTVATPGAALKGDDIEQRILSTGAGLLIVVVPTTLGQNGLFWAVPAGFIALKYGLPLRAIGLPPLPRSRDTGAGVLLGIGVALAAQVLGMGIDALAHAFDHVGWVSDALAYEKTNPVAQLSGGLRRYGGVGLLFGVLLAGVAAPLGEEMLFRGFVFGVLRRRFGVPLAVIGSAALFAALHTYALGLVVVFFMGVLLAWVYHTSGSLWTPIVIHATNNTLFVLLVYFFPEIAR